MTDWDDFAVKMLKKCKNIDPLFWSDTKWGDLKKAWGRVFYVSGLTEKAIESGVEHFYANDTTGERPTPGKIIYHAKLNRAEWLSTPNGRAWAESERLEREEERDRRLASGNWRPHGA